MKALVSWNGGGFFECKKSNGIVKCGTKRFDTSYVGNLLLGVDAISKSGDVVEFMSAGVRGSSSTSCFAFSSHAEVITKTQRTYKLKGLDLLYTVRQIETDTYPYAAMKF